MRHRLLMAVLVAASAATTTAAQTVTKVIDNGPDGGKKIIAVLGDGYASADQTKYNQDVDKLIVNGVFGNDFFRQQHNAFNVFRVNLVSKQSGVTRRVYDEKGTPNDPSDDTISSTTTRDTALKFIYSGSWSHCWLQGSPQTEALIQTALSANVPNFDYVVVILNEDGFGGCGGGGRQHVTRSSSWQVVAHEFGHGIGGLADEYDRPGTYTGATINGPNISTVLNRATTHWGRYIHPATHVPTKLTPGMDSARTVGLFEGAMYKDKGIYRPVDNCRMRGNTPNFCPVCQTIMRKALHPFLKHSFARVVVGDFNGGGRGDLLVHNGNDLAIYRTQASAFALEPMWIANNIVPAAPGGATWQPAPNDRYSVADFDGDGRDDVVVFNSSDWSMPYLGLLRSTGSGLECVARYDGSFPGFWQMKPGDQFFVGDFTGDKKADLVIFNGSNWSMPYLGLFRSTGKAFTGVRRYDGALPGWQMKPADRFAVGDFDGDGKADLFVTNTTNWGPNYLGMVRSTGSALSNVKLFTNTLPNWQMHDNDQMLVGDFDGDGKADLFISNTKDWGPAYLLMARSTGTNLAFVKRYDSTAGGTTPGWALRKGDRFYPSDVNKDGKADLFVYNPAINWTTEYLGTLTSTGTGLTGSWSAGWVGGWNLGPSDQLLVANYEGGKGKADLFIRNDQWLGMLRRTSGGLVMDRIYYHWIDTPLYDSKPWSDSLP